MSFTDTELDAYKRHHMEVLHVNEVPTTCGTCRMFKRLEAAELYVDAHREGRPPIALEELYAAWRKTAGK